MDRTLSLNNTWLFSYYRQLLIAELFSLVGRQDLNLDDYLDEDGSLKPGQAAHLKWRRNRTIFNSAQLKTLEETFHRQKYLSVGVRGKLARSLGLSEDQVKTWFQNRRTKFKKNVCIRPRPIVIPSVPAEILQNYPQHPYYRTTDIPRYPTIPSDVHKRTERSRTIHSYPVPRPVLPPALPSSFSREKIWNQFCPPV
jgi:BarH-like homeobox protein